MCKVFDFYKLQKDKGTWGLFPPEQEQIIALSVQIEQLKGGLKLLDQLQTKLKNFVNKSKQMNSCNKNKKAKGKFKTNKSKQHQYEAWKLIPPKDNEPKEKTANGKKLNWCRHHHIWTRHWSDSCKLQVKQQALKNETNTQETANLAINDDDNENTSINDDDISTAGHDSLWQELVEMIKTKI